MISALSVLFLLNLVQCYIYYNTDNDSIARAWAYGLATVASSLIFYLTSRDLKSDTELYAYGIYYDVVMAIVWSLLPFFLFNVQLSKLGFFGLGMIVFGAVLIRISGN